MPFDPLTAIGMVLLESGSGQMSPSGTCFLFRQDHVALTAAHCVPPTASRIQLAFPRQATGPAPVIRVARHPSADIAALFAEGHDVVKEGYPNFAFWDQVGNWGLGEEFMTFGYPSEGPAPDSREGPVARLFLGHYQRFFEYTATAGFRYLGGEMSIPAPGGLSGAPLFRPDAHQMVTGVVTSNLESYAVTDSTEELREDGSVYRLESRRVINYGLALMLSSVDDWLQDAVPHQKGTPRNR